MMLFAKSKKNIESRPVKNPTIFQALTQAGAPHMLLVYELKFIAPGAVCTLTSSDGSCRSSIRL